MRNDLETELWSVVILVHVLAHWYQMLVYLASKKNQKGNVLVSKALAHMLFDRIVIFCNPRDQQ